MTLSSKFRRLVESIPQIGVDWHQDTLLANTKANLSCIGKSIRSVPANDKPALLVCAGPSLYRTHALEWLRRPELRAKVQLVVTDGAYIRCLRRDIIPDYVLTIDPHPTRIVRWFGDPDIETNLKGDDYFERQDLDLDFRRQFRQLNGYNMKLVDQHPATLVICASAPANVVKRTTGWDRFWFAPLVDDPVPGSLTCALTGVSGLPAMNTGGTVGNACWVFAHAVLQSRNIACIGMDFGYAVGTPLEQTQSWNMMKHHDGVQDLYPEMQGVDGRPWYTDATYYWYRQNLLDLLDANAATLTNCTGGGTLMGRNVNVLDLESWLKSC